MSNICEIAHCNNEDVEEHMVKVLMPDYYKEFKCTGSNCESNCCKYWEISIEKDIYIKYQDIQDEDFKKKFNNITLLNEEKKSDRNYALMGFDNHNCTFLDKDGLCYIHKKYGETLLSDICKKYPRVFKKFDKLYQTSILNSCPEVLKLLMKNKRIKFEKKNIKGEELYHDITLIKVSSSKNNIIFIKEKFIEILQMDNLEIEKKLIILLKVAKEIDKVILAEEYINIEEVFHKFHNNTNNNEQETIGDIDLKLITIKEFIKKNVVRLNGIGRDFLKYMVMAFNITNKDNLKKGYKDYYLKSIEKDSYYMENYIVSELFNNFEYKIGENKYTYMVIKYILIYITLRNVIIGTGIYKGKLEKDDIWKIIFNFTRMSNHSEGFNKEVANFIHEYNLTEVNKIESLLKS